MIHENGEHVQDAARIVLDNLSSKRTNPVRKFSILYGDAEKSDFADLRLLRGEELGSGMVHSTCVVENMFRKGSRPFSFDLGHVGSFYDRRRRTSHPGRASARSPSFHNASPRHVYVRCRRPLFFNGENNAQS